MENRDEQVKHLNHEELEKAAGGSWIDDIIICKLKGHDFSLEAGLSTHDHFQYSYLKCKRCGEKRYTKQNFTTGEITRISKEEFEAVYY